MKQAFKVLVLLVAGLAVVGCGDLGPTDSDIAKEREKVKAANEQGMKENPPPPGEGPQN